MPITYNKAISGDIDGMLMYGIEDMLLYMSKEFK
jgi:hypothetical protein